MAIDGVQKPDNNISYNLGAPLLYILWSSNMACLQRLQMFA